MTWCPDARPLYHAALDGGYALPAYNVCSLEMAKGCLEAADAAGRPVILQTYPADIEQASPHVFAQLIRALADEVSVPVALHLDHGRDVNQVIACLRAGYGSVMFDGQGLPFDETLQMTAHLAAIAHASGAALEVSAESFGVPSANDNVLDTTDPEKARALRDAGADLVACAVGSEHGHASRIDLSLLSAIQARVGGPLVLHGGSGIHPGDLRAALDFGVTKVNVGSALYRAVRAAWVATTDLPTHRTGYASIRAAVRDVAAPYLDLLNPHKGTVHD
ncbi:class II fructose-bisphosphate aldolase [Deinococcus sp.]|uniref:class II fructose-bisphosphate aldolase n=1 Tax=Deinococcus sp. TaxID=47478 RepID=UPI002869EBC9|nr:class II fructose-bisphosphate aldolase [Deinococcus sp.]